MGVGYVSIYAFVSISVSVFVSVSVFISVSIFMFVSASVILFVSKLHMYSYQIPYVYFFLLYGLSYTLGLLAHPLFLSSHIINNLNIKLRTGGQIGFTCIRLYELIIK